jgi:hypothetical protein
MNMRKKRERVIRWRGSFKNDKEAAMGKEEYEN